MIVGKVPNIHWKTADWKLSGHFNKLEHEEAERLHTFDQHLTGAGGEQTRNKTLSAEGGY